MKYNKGEWTEAYVFIKLIADGEVYASDEYLNRNEKRIYPILKVFKDEIKCFYENDKEIGIVNILNFEGDLIDSLSSTEFIEIANESLKMIKEGKGRSFEIPILKNFLNEIGIKNFKGSSTKKEDIKLEIMDLDLETAQILTFTIKSYLGAKPTLLNASNLTNFLFKIEGITPNEVKELNAINKKSDKHPLKTRFNIIYERFLKGKYNISLVNEDKILYQNLRLIDSNLPEILSYILLYYYSHERISDISSLTEKLIEYNPLNLDNSEKNIFYKKKIRDFIESITLGMMPNNKWNGKYEITGGLLSVKNDGEILCHHLFYDIDPLKTFLFNNVKLESPSTSRHKYGELFIENNETFFKLNLQLRIK